MDKIFKKKETVVMTREKRNVTVKGMTDSDEDIGRQTSATQTYIHEYIHTCTHTYMEEKGGKKVIKLANNEE